MEGEETYTCSCGDSYTKAIPKLEHSSVTDAAVAATCTFEGKTEGKHCSVCGTVLVAQTNIAALGHKEVVIEGKAATCTTAGLTEGKKCSVCEAITVAQREIAAAGHTYDSDMDLDCNNCGASRGYWTDWTDGGTSEISGTNTRQVELREVTVTATRYRYRRCVWYNSSGVYVSSQRPQVGYTEGTVKKGSKTYRWDYSEWYDAPIPVVWKTYSGSSNPVSTYSCNGTTYYTEETEDSSTVETHYFYRDIIYY